MSANTHRQKEKKLIINYKTVNKIVNHDKNGITFN